MALSREVALGIGVVCAIVIYIAGKMGIVLDEPTVQNVVTPIVIGFLTRFFVSPAEKAGV